MNRRQQEEKLLTTSDTETGQTQELLALQMNSAWLNLDDDTRIPHWLPDGSGFLWTTERRGDWQAELHERSGALVRALTPVGFHLTEIVDVDEKAKTSLSQAGRIHANNSFTASHSRAANRCR